MQREDYSEDINPWTVRGTKQRKGNLNPKTKPIKNKFLPLGQSNQNNVRPTVPDQIQKLIQLPLVRQTISLRISPQVSDQKVKQLDKVLNQDLYSKFLPSYKLIDISFDSKSKPSRKSKIIPYHIKALRQYTDPSELKRKKLKHSQDDKYSRRLPTEESHSEHFHIEKELNKSIDSGLRNHRKRQEQEEMMIIHQRKKANTIDLRSNIYHSDRIAHIWQNGGTLANRLSLMKKHYNITKIKKLVN